MNKSNVLNIFVHIPKTAGYNFKQSIEASFSQDGHVRTGFTHFQSFYDLKQKRMDFFEGKDHFINYIRSLSEQQRKKIKFLGGHTSYYGIHELFKREPRYFTFIREPVARTISLYNYERMAWSIHSQKRGPLNKWEEAFLKRMKENFLIDNQVPAFEVWLNEIYDKKIPFYYSMTRFLKTLGFLDDEANLDSLSEGLNKFYFTGITERYEENALYLYHELRVNKFVLDANASTPYVSRKKLGKDVIAKIEELNKEDRALYEAALKKNERFRENTVNFYAAVDKVRAKQIRFEFRKAVLSKVRRILDLFLGRFNPMVFFPHVMELWRKRYVKSNG